MTDEYEEPVEGKVLEDPTITVQEMKDASLIPSDEDKVELGALAERFYIEPYQVVRSPERLAEITKAIGYMTPAEKKYITARERARAVNEGVLE